MPTPSFPQTIESPASPRQYRQLAPGGGVGGFTSIPPPHRGFTRDDFRHTTPDHAYRFDAEFSPHSDSNLPHYETAGISEGIHAGVWSTYNKISKEIDEKRLGKWSDDLDVLLIFVSLVVERGH